MKVDRLRELATRVIEEIIEPAEFVRLNDSKREAIKARFGETFFKECQRRSSLPEVSASTFYGLSKGRICLQCKYKVCDQRGSCSSLCGGCLSNGFSPKDYRTERTQQTCMEMYGTKAAAQSDSVKEIIKKACLKKFGATNIFGSKQFRDQYGDFLRKTGKQRVASMRKHFEDTYGPGIVHWAQVPELRKNFQKSMEEKHGKGITNVMHVPEYKEKHASRMSELAKSGFYKDVYANKVVPTVREKYGVDNVFEDTEYMKQKRLEATGYEFPLQNPKSKKQFETTCLERYGGTHHMHSPEIFNKVASNKRTMHLYGLTHRKTEFRVLGTDEIFVLQHLLTKYSASDLKTGFDLKPLMLSVSSRYYPDFYIKSKDRYIEAKSEYTLLGCHQHKWSLWKRNKKKAKEALKNGINLVWVIPSPKKELLIVLPTLWFTLSRSVLQKLIRTRFEEAEAVATIPLEKLQLRRLGEFGKLPTKPNLKSF